MFPKIKLVKIFKTCFFIFKTLEFASKNVCPIERPNWHMIFVCGHVTSNDLFHNTTWQLINLIPSLIIEEKLLCHIVMVAIFLDDNKQEMSLKKVSLHCCKLHLSCSISFFFLKCRLDFLGLNPKGKSSNYHGLTVRLLAVWDAISWSHGFTSKSHGEPENLEIAKKFCKVWRNIE